TYKRSWRKRGPLGAVLVVTSDSERTTFRHGIARVDGEIDQSQFKLVGIDLNSANLWGDLCANKDGWANGMPQEIQHFRYQRLQRDAFNFQLLPPGKCKQARRQRGTAFGALDRPVEQ